MRERPWRRPRTGADPGRSPETGRTLRDVPALPWIGTAERIPTLSRDLENFERFRTRGDVAALERVFDKTASELMRVALHLASDPARAEDLVQATFVSAIEHAASWDRGRPLLPWLLGILARQAARARREAGRSIDPERLVERESLDPADESASAELSRRLASALHALPSPYRDVLEPHLLEGARAVDIARQLDRAPGTVRMQILRGLELLRRALPASLATTGLLAIGTRGHAAVRAAVLRKAGETAGALAAGSSASVPPLLFLGGLAMSVKTALALAASVLGVAGLWWLLDSRSPREESRAGLAVAQPAEAELLTPPVVQVGSEAEESRTSVPGLAPSTAGEDATDPRAATDPPPDELRGRVVDARRAPVAGARVSIRRGELRQFNVLDPELMGSTELVAETRSDSAGEFRFPLARGVPVDVHADLAGFTESIEANRFAGQFVELVLTRGVLVHGVVTRARDGSPVEGARVRVFRQGGPGFLRRETTTRPDGSYELCIGSAEGALLEVYPLVECCAPRIPLELGADGTCEQDVVVEEGVLVEGRVTEAGTGLALEGALIGDGWMYRRSAVTDARGEYRLRSFGRPGYSEELHAKAPGFGQVKRRDLPAALDGRLRVDFELARAHAVRGRVVDTNAAPVARAYVAAVASDWGPQGQCTDWASARTDADGRFHIDGLSPDRRHALLVSHADHATQVYDFPESEAARMETDLGQIVLRAPALLCGRVHDEQGQGLAVAVVTLKGWNSDRFLFAGGAETGNCAEASTTAPLSSWSQPGATVKPRPAPRGQRRRTGRTVTSNVQTEAFPESSVAVQITVVRPRGK